MLAYVLAAIIALCSFALYMAAFFFPTIHRRDDFVWSGLGLFYALMLWVCAGQIRGGVLLGQMASTGLIVWFIWETVTLRRLLILKEQDTVITPELEAKFKKFSPIKFFQSFTGKKVAPIAVKPEPTEIPTPEATTNSDAEEPKPKDSDLKGSAPEPSSPSNVATTPTAAPTSSSPRVAAQEQRLKPEPVPSVAGNKATNLTNSELEAAQPPTDPEPEAEVDALDGLVEVLEESLEETANFEPPPIKNNPLKGLLAKVTGLFAKKSPPTSPIPAIEEEEDDPFDFEEEVPPPVAAEDQLPPPELQETKDGSQEVAVTPEDNDGAVAFDQPEIPSSEAGESPATTVIAADEPDPITVVQSVESVEENSPTSLESDVSASSGGTTLESIQELGSTDEINALLSPKPSPQPKVEDPKAETPIEEAVQTAAATPEVNEEQEADDVDPSSSPAEPEQAATETTPDPVIKKVNSPYDSLS